MSLGTYPNCDANATCGQVAKKKYHRAKTEYELHYLMLNKERLKKHLCTWNG